MSGHSKWATIRHKKGAADAKRGALFSKLSKAITVASREGGADATTNFSLRLAVEKAKAANMPKDNIERAIAKGQGTGDADQLHSAVYEAMGPGAAAIVIEAVSDNPNRTVTNVKMILNKRGANPNAKVAWMFERKGVAYVEDVGSVEDKDALELALIDAGAEDVSHSGARMTVVCAIADLNAVVEALKTSGLAVEGAGIEYVAKDELQLSGADEEKLAELIEALEDDDDVSAVYTNAG